MNQPTQQMFAFPGVTAPPAPAAAANPSFPMFHPPTPSPTIDWEANARSLIKTKVVIDGQPVTTEQMTAWAYAQLEQRMRAGGVTSGVAERMCKTLESLPNGSVILGSEPEPQLTPEQRQAAIMGLVPRKLTYKGTPCAGTAEQIGAVVNWLWNSLPAVTAVPEQDKRLIALHKWLEGITGTYEVDDATRAAAPALQQAPPNAVSDQKTPQVAVMAQPIVAPVATPEGEPEVAGEAPVIDPVDGTPCKSVRGLKTRATKTHKTDWVPFCQQHGLDQTTGRKIGAPAPVAPGIVAPPSPPPISQPLPALVGQGAPVTAPSNTLYGPDGKPTPAYAAAQAAAQAQDMPSPPVQQPTAPVQFTPTFAPPGQPGGVVVPQVATVPPAVITPTFAPPSTGHTVVQSMPIAGNMAIGTQQPAGVPAGLDRAGMAQALGGAVTLIVCRLLEAGSANLTGRVDANQLSLLAEKAARDEMRIVDLAQGSYGSGKQAAQRHFAELLTKYPHCYLLMNGYEPILPAGFLEILIARTVHVYQVTDQGRSGVEIKF